MGRLTACLGSGRLLTAWRQRPMVTIRSIRIDLRNRGLCCFLHIDGQLHKQWYSTRSFGDHRAPHASSQAQQQGRCILRNLSALAHAMYEINFICVALFLCAAAAGFYLAQQLQQYLPKSVAASSKVVPVGIVQVPISCTCSPLCSCDHAPEAINAHTSHALLLCAIAWPPALPWLRE